MVNQHIGNHGLCESSDVVRFDLRTPPSRSNKDSQNYKSAYKPAY